MFLKFVFWFLFFCHVNARDQKINFIRSFIKQQKELTTANVFLCENTDIIRYFMANIQKDDVFINVKNPDLQTPQLDKDSKINVLDMSCNNYLEVLKQANSKNLFRLYYQWLILVPQSDKLNLIKLREIFENFNIFFNSRMVLGFISSKPTYELSYVHKSRRIFNIIFDSIGYWDVKTKRFSFKPDLLRKSRRNVNLLTLKSTFVYTTNDTLNHLTDNRNRNVDTQLKIGYTLTNHIFDYMNATRAFYYETSWGDVLPNKTFTGLIGHILRREIDISGSPLFCLADRLPYTDCIAMTVNPNSFFTFKQPPLSYVANIYTLPFDVNLWLTDIVFLIVSSVLLYLVVRWEWKVRNENEEIADNTILESSFWESVLFTMSAVCQQGYNSEPQSASGKIIMLTIFFSMIFIFTAYSANTVVLFQSSASHIKTLKDLYDSKLELGVDNKPYFISYFPREKEAIKQKIYSDRIAPKNEKPHFYPLLYGVDKMRKGYFAFYADDASIYKVISDTFQEHEKCGLEYIPYLEFLFPWVTTPKYSIYFDSFKVGYRRLLETGIQRKIMQSYYYKKPECLTKGSNFRSAGILDLYSVYMLFFIGLGSSLTILIFEIFNGRYLRALFSRKNKT